MIREVTFADSAHLYHDTHAFVSLKPIPMMRTVATEIWLRVLYAKHKVYERIHGTSKRYVNLTEQPQFKENSKGIFLLIHGLFGHPSNWDCQMKLLQEKMPEYDVKSVYVPHAGNADTAEVLGPIKDYINCYTEQFPENKVCILGTSNGGKLACEIDLFLRSKPNAVKLSVVSGALLGSKTMDFVKRFWLARALFHPKVREELSFLSEDAKGRVARVQEAAKNRDYDFYATNGDFIITPRSASFPVVDQAHYFTVENAMHSSIVRQVAKHQVERCITWMRN